MANRYPLIVDSQEQRIKELPTSDNLDLRGTGALILPVGTTAQRPSTPIAGMFRFNTDISKFEGYDGIEWVEIQAGLQPEFTFEGDLGSLSGTEDLESGAGTVDLMD